MNKDLIQKIKTHFLEQFKLEPLLIFSPGRINIIGEHTDYNDGFVFPAAIDKGIVAAIQKSNTNVCTIHALDKNENYQFSLGGIEPLANGDWRNYIIGVVALLQEKGKKVEPFDMVFGGDIPAGAGLSSSAALENSVVFGLNELFNLELSKKDMIYISQQAEHQFAGVKCGIMDQYASMFGQKNTGLLLDCRTIESKPFYIDFKEYQLLLINTNVKHSLSDSAYNDRRSVCEKVAHLLGVKALRDASEEVLLKIKSQISEEDYQKSLYVIQENRRVELASKAMESSDILKLGELLYQSHNGLQHQYKVSCDELDFLVEKAMESTEIIGARMMGGGFGGCTINLIKNNSDDVIETIVKAYQSKFNIKPSVYQVNIEDGVRVL